MNSAHRQKGKTVRAGVHGAGLKTIGETHRGYLHDRGEEAIRAAIQRAEKAEDFKAQHGRVRVLMVDGKPGPDAPKADGG